MWDNPRQVADMTIEFWAAQQQLWQNSMLKWLGSKEAVEDLKLPHMMKADKRFAHKEWSENAVFEYLKQSYLLTSGWIQDSVSTVGEMDPKERRKAAFYTRYFVEAMNPANFFALNPEVLEATAEQKGENLVRGLKMMLKDLERGKGKLLIRQTDMDAFEVGRNTAVSPRGGRLRERPDPAHPVRAGDREGLRQAAADHPALDQQVLHPRPQPEEEPGQVAGRAGPYRLRRLLGEPRRAARVEVPGRTTCSRAG